MKVFQASLLHPCFCLFVTLAAITGVCYGTNPELLVTVLQGQLKGTTMKSLDGKEFFAFRGIPYAEPPIDDLRFKAPRPAAAWEGVLDATEESEVCAQVPLMGNETFIGSEDCLYLNVYTPMIPKEDDELLPVLFWIHGGAFYAGDGGIAENGPEFLLDQPLVLVTINYRLGPFGFLSSGNQVIPGNFGLKDQVMALKWVRDNIAVFGGDNNRVTLHGYSAGAVCVEAHLYSALSKGLFHGAVIQSGSRRNDCLFYSQPGKVLQVLASLMGCDQVKAEGQLKCLRTKPASKLAQAIYKFPHWAIKIPEVYNPVVEWAGRDESWEEEPFLSEEPEVLISERRVPNDVPVITGIANAEGAAVGTIIAQDSDNLERLENNFELVTRLAFCLQKLNAKKFPKIKKFYFGSRKINKRQSKNLGKLYSDIKFAWGQVNLANKLASILSKPVYFYVFSFVGRINELVALNLSLPYEGVGHADDLAYIFRRRVPFPEGKPNDEERATIKRMGRILANFVATGDPTPSVDDLLDTRWLPLPRDVTESASKFKYLEISSKLEMNQGTPFADRMSFWQRMMNKNKNKKIRDEL